MYRPQSQRSRHGVTVFLALVLGTLIILGAFHIESLNVHSPVSPVYATGITRVQGNARGTSVTSTITITQASAPTSGNMVILVVGIAWLTSTTVSSVSQTGVIWSGGGNGLQVQYNPAADYRDTEIWLGTVGAGASATITITLSRTPEAGSVADACEYSGLVAAASVLDKTATNSAGGGTSTSGDTGTTATTTQANELWIGGIHAGTGGVSVAQSNPTNGFTLLDGADYSGNAHLSTVYLEKIVSSTGTANSGTTIANTARWSGAIATFKATPLYALNTKVVAFDGSTVLTGASVTMNNGTDQVKTVSSGWANYTGISAASVTVKASWENSWVNGTFTETMGADRTITIVAKVYLSYALNWRYNNNSTAFTPTSVLITAPNGTDVTVSGSYTLSKVQNGTWTVKSITYWGNNIVAVSHPTFAATGDSQNRQMSARVYSVVIANTDFKDDAGSALYAAPSAFSISTPNATTITATGTYWIQNGTSTLSSVTWEGTNVTPASNTFDATSGSPSFNLKVYSLTLSFKDSSGAALYTGVASYSIQFPNSTIANGRTASSYSQVQYGPITLTNVLWEASHVTAASNTYSLTSTSTWTMSLKIYALHLKHQDNLAIDLAQNVQYTFPNGTALTKTPISGWVDLLQVQNGTVTLTTPITVSGTERYVLTDSATISLTVDTTQTEHWRHDLKSVTLQAKDSTGAVILSPQLTTFTVQMSNGTSIANPTNLMWLPTGTTTLTVATWEGSNVCNSATVSITAQVTYYFNVGVYSRTLTFRYSDGATTFVPTQIQFTAPNGTQLPMTSYTNVLLQNGTTTIISITYWGTNVVTIIHPSFDASTGNAWINAQIYPITPVWKDSAGAALSVQPTSYKILGPNATLSGALASGTGYWFQNGTALFRLITWEGSNVTPSAGGGFSIESGSPTVNLRIYSVTLQGRDQSSNVLNGVTTFTVTYPNATIISYTANATGYRSWSQVQNGTYSVVLLWNGVIVNSTLTGTVTANWNIGVTGLVYYTATNSFRAAVDAGTLSNIVASDVGLSFDATAAAGAHTIKAYVGAKGMPKGVYIDGTLKTLNADYTYDAATTIVSIPYTFSTHTILISWSSVLTGPTGSSSSGGLTITPQTVAEQVQKIVEVVTGNPYIVGFIAMGGLFGGAGIAYRYDRKRTSAFLAIFGAAFVINCLFFWNWLPQAALQTNLGILPLTVDKYLIPIPSLEIPTVWPSGQEIATGIMTIGLLSIFVSIIAWALTHD